MTQASLAAAIGMDPFGVSRWERGRVMPRPETLELIADALGVPVGSFYIEPELEAA